MVEQWLNYFHSDTSILMLHHLVYVLVDLFQNTIFIQTENAR